MKKLSGLLLLFLGCASVYEFFSLLTKEIDGDGIAIYLLGFEISDSVRIGEVALYAYSFLGAGLLLIILAGILFYRSRIEKKQL